MGKSEEKKKLKREALLTSAFDLFTEKGINKTTVSDIVKKAELAKGTFYLYYKDKYDIRDKLIAMRAVRIIEQTGDELIKEGNEREVSFEDGIIFMADKIIDRFTKNKPLLLFMGKHLSEAIFTRGSTEEEKNRCLEIFDKLIEPSGKVFRNKNVMFYLLIEVMNSTCYDCIIRNAPVSMDEMRPELYATLMSIIKQFEV